MTNPILATQMFLYSVASKKVLKEKKNFVERAFNGEFENEFKKIEKESNYQKGIALDRDINAYIEQERNR